MAKINAKVIISRSILFYFRGHFGVFSAEIAQFLDLVMRNFHHQQQKYTSFSSKQTYTATWVILGYIESVIDN